MAEDKVEIIVCKRNEGRNKYSEYNRRMKKSNAKYKVYIDENVQILNENYIDKLLQIFKDNPDIGIIGCSGAERLSTNGLAFKSTKRFGKFYTGKNQKLITWSEVQSDYQEVAVIDGFFMATQYDIPWREDLFNVDDDIFAFPAQSIEFKRKGYKSVVVNQSETWIWNKTNQFVINKEAQEIFLKEYSKDLYPAVLILIPTFNRPEYFKVALDSAINQTYKNIEIVISDNSTNDETEQLMQSYLEQYPNIKYFHHRGFNANDNWNFLRRYQAEDTQFDYVNWLMDDDLFYPNKIEVMMEIFLNNSDVSLVTSARNQIDENGNVTGKLGLDLKEEGVLKGHSIGKDALFNMTNRIGEPTTVLIKKNCLRDKDLCWSDDEQGFFSLIDLSTWLQLLSKGNMGFYPEPLSALRVHNNMTSLNRQMWNF